MYDFKRTLRLPVASRPPHSPCSGLAVWHAPIERSGALPSGGQACGHWEPWGRRLRAKSGAGAAWAGA
jgi:hypothetical protein